MTSEQTNNFSIVVAADSTQFTCMNLDGSVATAAKNADGIIQDSPKAGQAGALAVFGKSKALVNDTISAGDLLEVGTDGKLVEHDAGTAVAKALEDGVAGNVISVLILKSNAAFA